MISKLDKDIKLLQANEPFSVKTKQLEYTNITKYFSKCVQLMTKHVKQKNKYHTKDTNILKSQNQDYLERRLSPLAAQVHGE